MDLLPNLETSKCVHSLNGFIARRGKTKQNLLRQRSYFRGSDEWHEMSECRIMFPSTKYIGSLT